MFKIGDLFLRSFSNILFEIEYLSIKETFLEKANLKFFLKS